jgi:hypothetical protein
MAQDLVLEMREELAGDSAMKKIRLYERSLGLAVVPYLVARAVYRLAGRLARPTGRRP